MRSADTAIHISLLVVNFRVRWPLSDVFSYVEGPQ